LAGFLYQKACQVAPPLLAALYVVRGKVNGFNLGAYNQFYTINISFSSSLFCNQGVEYISSMGQVA